MLQFARTPLFCEILCTVVDNVDDVIVRFNPVDIYEQFIDLCWDRKSASQTVTVADELVEAAKKRYIYAS